MLPVEAVEEIPSTLPIFKVPDAPKVKIPTPAILFVAQLSVPFTVKVCAAAAILQSVFNVKVLAAATVTICTPVIVNIPELENAAVGDPPVKFMAAAVALLFDITKDVPAKDKSPPIFNIEFLLPFVPVFPTNVEVPNISKLPFVVIRNGLDVGDVILPEPDIEILPVDGATVPFTLIVHKTRWE